MKNKSYKKLIEEYQAKYGNIPFEKNEIISYLEDSLKITDKDRIKIKQDEEHVESIPWETLQIILPIIPKPSPRPRYSGATGSFYVTGAAENKKLLKYYLTKAYPIIYTQVYFTVTCYLPTPVSQMNKSEIIRAEKGTVSAMSNPDWDNLGKTYSDIIQGILILNDNTITKGYSEKYYSIKPRVIIDIKYQKGFDSKYNTKRVMNSKKYTEAIEIGNIIEVYTEGDEYFA